MMMDIKDRVLMIFALVVLAVTIVVDKTTDYEVPEKSIYEPIPFRQQIEHDTDKAFEEYIHSLDDTEEIEEVIAAALPYDDEPYLDLEAINPNYLIEVTQKDIDLMARVVMSEASVLNFEAKQAVAQTIVNRVRSNKFPDSVYEVVFEKNAFSTQQNGKPTQNCYVAVEQALLYQDYPVNMFYFRTGHYHTWAKDYKEIDGCYFSTD